MGSLLEEYIKREAERRFRTMEKRRAINYLREFSECLDHGSRFVNKYGRDITKDMKEAISSIILDFDCGGYRQSSLTPAKIIHNGRATIVVWDEKGSEKTIVKLAEGQTYDEYTAFCAALAKRIFETNSSVKRAIKKATVVQEKKSEQVPQREDLAGRGNL